jgi:hypothetical protein
MIDVESRHGEAGAGETHCQRQANVAKADNPDTRFALVDFVQKRSQRAFGRFRYLGQI